MGDVAEICSLSEFDHVDAPYRVALVVPMQGPAGIFGPSCEAVAQLAATQVNAAGGVLGRPVAIEVVDGGAPPHRIATELDRLVRGGEVHAVTGWHISAVRQELAAVIDRRLPYVYTALYEGGERTPGVFCTGETPRNQLEPALRWLRDMMGVHRWCIIGDDYIWPRASAAATRGYARELGLSIVDEVYVRLGEQNFEAAVKRVQQSDADGVLMFLVGQDAVLFNRLFASRGMHDQMVRFTPLMEENMLLASGSAATHNLFVAASYFRSLATGGALDLMGDYVRAYGPTAPPLNNAAESCYEGVQTLVALIERAGSHEMNKLLTVSDNIGYDGPRGVMQMHNGHLRQSVHLAVADGFEFDILTAL